MTRQPKGRSDHRRRVGRLALGGMLLIAVGCGASIPPANTPSTSIAIPMPSGPPVLGIDWGRAASVERPVNFEVDPSASAYTGTHPILRIPGQATMSDVSRLRDGGFVAVGYVPPTWVPAAWTSRDGRDWTLHPMDTTDFTFAVSVATGADGGVNAVGRSGPSPVSWSSDDGVTWQRHSVPILGRNGVGERMTTVVATAHGYLAGGSAGPELADRHARFWSSTDGVAWQPVRDDALAFANSEVRAITSFGDGFVAVGVVGTAQRYTDAVAWTSANGSTWTRIDDPAFEGGLAVAVTAAPFGGLVAVGSDVDRREAVAWTSADGRGWTRAPSEAAREHSGGYAWMTDVTAIGATVVGIGDYQGLQRGTATSWVSRDGIRWTPARSAPVQEQGEFYAITPGGPGAIAVGSFGAPDSYVPTVWLSPAR
ncbi:MAG: hypothetical protein QOF49_311 [Chloroflexota bacterium]|nr:hypothetical protein [Chloroflexota bacterium]